MTTKPNPITMPCVCHVPPPEGTARIEIRKAKKGEWYWSESEHKWKQADKDFCFLEICVAILAPQYDYPTPVEACRMLAEAGGPIECEGSDDGEKWAPDQLRAVDIGGICPCTFLGCSRWYMKIRTPKRG